MNQRIRIRERHCIFMNKFCTIISVSLSFACFVYMFNADIYSSCVTGLIVLAISIIGFSLENRAPYYWNSKLNKFLFYVSRNDREYNVECKEYIYTRLSDKEYKYERLATICPTCNNLDRVQERFSWSAPSNGVKISALDQKHEIAAIRQQELWTYYSIYFHQTFRKKEIVKTGSVVHNLIDQNNQAVPFLSVTVDRKTRLLVMRVHFENDNPPQRALFKIYSSKNPSKEIYSEDLQYDNVIKGFSRTVDFPRQNGKYTIIWQ